MDAQYNIYDGAHVETNCTDINKAQFSYNNAVFLLGAAHMYNFVSIPDLLQKKQKCHECNADHSLDRERRMEAASTGSVDRYHLGLLSQQCRLRSLLRGAHDLHDRHAELQGV